MNNASYIATAILGAVLATGLLVAGLHLGFVPLSADSVTDTNPVIVEQNSTTDSASTDALESIVSIHVQDEDYELDDSQGSGFVYTEDYIVTNEHVLENTDEIYVQYYDGEWAEAKIVGEDSHSDIAVLEPKTHPEYADPLPIQTELPETGEPVYALGTPVGLENTVTQGIFSGTERSMNTNSGYTIPDMIQTDAALNPGNSGGALITEQGAVIGVNTATEGENIGFAVSSRITDSIAQSLINTGDHSHAYVGISTTELTPVSDEAENVTVDSGLYTVEVVEDSPAFDAEIQKGDVILDIDGQSVESNEELSSYLLREKTPDDTLEVTLYRDGETVDTVVELDERP